LLITGLPAPVNGEMAMTITPMLAAARAIHPSETKRFVVFMFHNTPATARNQKTFEKTTWMTSDV